MLSAHNLAKNYKGRDVVKDVSIEISQSQIVGLLGPNGAGKTTCFYMIVGLIQADSGRVLLDQKDMTKLPIHDRGRHGLSYLPQESSIFRNLTVEENVLAILQARQELTREQRRKNLNSCLGIQHRAYQKQQRHEFVGGERRRTEAQEHLPQTRSSFC